MMKRLIACAFAISWMGVSLANAGEQERVTLSVASVSLKPNGAGEPALFITLSQNDQKALAAFSERHVGSRVSISVGGREVSRPMLVSPLRSAETALTCGKEDCNTLAKAIDDAGSITVSTVP
jgi:hypothetical protein